VNPRVENAEMSDRSAKDELVESGLVKDVERFVARILREKHQAALAAGAPDGARIILEVAQWFADDMAATDPGFDRTAFIEAVTEDPS
jgi:hypothetical protein